jgi:enamine deaminase RidA (YjgF/YER057c/UK114 family)
MTEGTDTGLGAEVDLAAGQDAARVCALNVLAQLQAAAGCLDAVTRLVRLTVFVACTDDFVQQPQVSVGTVSQEAQPQ